MSGQRLDIGEHGDVHYREKPNGRVAASVYFPVCTSAESLDGRRVVDQAATAVLEGISPPGHDGDNQPPAVQSVVG